MHSLDVMERADRAIHSVAQTHLTEFVGTVDLYPSVGEGDGSRTRPRTRIRSAHLPTPLAYGLRIASCPGIHGVCKPEVSE